MKIVKIPQNTGALKKKSGIEKAPDDIEKQLKNFYLKESHILPIFEFEEINIDNSDIEKSNSNILHYIKKLDVPAVIIGGDHSMTYSGFKGFALNHNNPGLLVFDAHLDCINSFSPPTHEDYLRVLIEEKVLKKENAIIVGARNIHHKEVDFARKNKLKIFDMKEISFKGKAEVSDSIMYAARQFDALYISIDIDVLDPAFAPGTGYTEPGGLTTRELIYFIQRLKNLKNIKLWDLVEVNPDKDINNLTSITAAKLVVELC